MRRRQFLPVFLIGFARAAWSATSEATGTSITGTLVEPKSGDEKTPSAIRLPDGRNAVLSGDDETEKVVHDPRLAGVQLEAVGHFTTPGQFAVDPRFEKNLFVHKDGKRLIITYWCDVCSIRTYAPGVCVCCQKWTDLDLRDPNQE
jgi:hypothetical protein